MTKTAEFWDSSALVPLCVDQGSSTRVARALRNVAIVVWWNTAVEMTSAFARLSRSGDIGERQFDMALARLAALERRWLEVLPEDPVKDLAKEMIRRHPLRAADALQLAAALIWSRLHPRGRPFVCFDGRLAAAALAEGFQVKAL